VAGRTLVIDPATLRVDVTDGVVRLEGEMETRSLARILVRLAGAVEGVVAVDDRLTWRLDDARIGAEQSPLALHLTAEERE